MQEKASSGGTVNRLCYNITYLGAIKTLNHADTLPAIPSPLPVATQKKPSREGNRMH
jgi:hypothetical protein